VRIHAHLSVPTFSQAVQAERARYGG